MHRAGVLTVWGEAEVRSSQREERKARLLPCSRTREPALVERERERDSKRGGTLRGHRRP